KAEGGAAVNFHAPARLRTGVLTPLTDTGTGIRRGAVPLAARDASASSLFRALALPQRPEFAARNNALSDSRNVRLFKIFLLFQQGLKHSRYFMITRLDQDCGVSWG